MLECTDGESVSGSSWMTLQMTGEE